MKKSIRKIVWRTRGRDSIVAGDGNDFIDAGAGSAAANDACSLEAERRVA